VRLRRIEGQVRGVFGMVEQRRDPAEITRQLQSVNEAVRATTRELFHACAEACAAMPERRSAERLLHNLIGVIRQFDL